MERNRLDDRNVVAVFEQFVSQNTEPNAGDQVEVRYLVLNPATGRPSLVVVARSTTYGERHLDISPWLPDRPSRETVDDLNTPIPESYIVDFPTWESYVESLLEVLGRIATSSGRIFAKRRLVEVERPEV